MLSISCTQWKDFEPDHCNVHRSHIFNSSGCCYVDLWHLVINTAMMLIARCNNSTKRLSPCLTIGFISMSLSITLKTKAMCMFSCYLFLLHVCLSCQISSTAASNATKFCKSFRVVRSMRCRWSELRISCINIESKG